MRRGWGRRGWGKKYREEQGRLGRRIKEKERGSWGGCKGEVREGNRRGVRSRLGGEEEGA